MGAVSCPVLWHLVSLAGPTSKRDPTSSAASRFRSYRLLLRERRQMPLSRNRSTRTDCNENLNYYRLIRGARPRVTHRRRWAAHAVPPSATLPSVPAGLFCSWLCRAVVAERGRVPTIGPMRYSVARCSNSTIPAPQWINSVHPCAAAAHPVGRLKPAISCRVPPASSKTDDICLACRFAAASCRHGPVHRGCKGLVLHGHVPL